MPEIPASQSYFPPSGFDRASGLDGFPGTPTPDSVIQVSVGDKTFDINTTLDGTNTFFEEYPDSPEIERAEQATITHRYCCDYNTAIELATSISRGQLLMDSGGNITRVLSCKLNFKKGGFADFTVVSEGVSFDVPPDEFSVETTELNPALDKHPRYDILSYGDRKLIKSYINTDNLDLQNSALNAISASITGSHRNPALELLLKSNKNIDSFYLPGFKIQWSQYYWAPTELNPGGYIEDPIEQGALPYFFWDTDTTPEHIPDPNAASIFVDLASINPNIYNNGISWLRQADTLTLQRTWFRLTRTWIGGPLGKWDPELYTVTDQETGADDNGNPPYSLPYQTKPDQGGFSF